AESQLKFERVSTPDLEADAKSEDVDALVVDYNTDGLQDLLVLSGGGEFPEGHEANELRFYQQTPSGGLLRDREALAQPLRLNGGSLAFVDQSDGHWQVVVAARSVVDNYGERPPMYVIYPDQSGKLQSASIDIDWPSIGGAGLIRDIDVAELTQDGWPDLLIASEWGPIVLFPGSAEGFRPRQAGVSEMLRPAEVLPSKNGFWSAIATADLDADGDLDILAGNLGTNSKLAADSNHLVKLYYDDFDGNGKREQVITYTSPLGERPFATREEIIGQLPGLRQIVPDHTSFAEASLQSLFPANQLASAQQFVIDQTRSIWLENRGNGQWTSHELPDEIQSGPVELILPGLDNDWLFFGQDRGANIQRGHYDATLGWSLASGYFTQNQGSPSPLYVDGRVKDGLLLEGTNGRGYLLAINAESLQLLMELGLNR
ncbi:MAG: FG-GAP-like repeat-containing protein, partial [Bacteroidota bacterium]